MEVYCILRIDKLDLGENFISVLPPSMFNGTLSITDLNLDYNYIGTREGRGGEFDLFSIRKNGLNRLLSITSPVLYVLF